MGTRQVRPVIDADSHVMEPAEVCNYLPDEYEARKPFIITGEDKPFLQGMNSFWYIDGKRWRHSQPCRWKKPGSRRCRRGEQSKSNTASMCALSRKRVLANWRWGQTTSRSRNALG
jgi:hypothetical protein